MLPPLDAAGHLVDHFFDVGPSTAGEALTYQEIAAWLGLTGVLLNGWEAGALRTMSAAFLAEYQASDDPERPPPYRPAERLVSRVEVSEKAEHVLGRWERQDDKLTLPAPAPARKPKRPKKTSAA